MKFTKKIEAWDIMTVFKNLGINENHTKILMEAYKRRYLVSYTKGVDGNGTTKQYKTKWFTPMTKQEVIDSGQNITWKLTAKGEEILKMIAEIIKPPTNQPERDQLIKVINNL